MRLLDVDSYKLVSINPGNPPPYAILSHTWGEEEVTFQDLTQGTAKQNAGYSKLAGARSVTKYYGYRYIWIDTCCIDKSSSAELSEAINSMFKWYQNATICYAYLEDVDCDPRSDTGRKCINDISKSRWFTRGWTLQELIAPSEVVFFSRHWDVLGTRTSLANAIAAFTKISRKVLVQGAAALQEQSVATRMSWAAKRNTTRPEDIAYCLLGLFDVQMPLLYGEGQTKAFIRLQEEILRTSADQSILAWTPMQDSSLPFRGAFAIHPDEFTGASNIVPLPSSEGDCSIVGGGLQIRLRVVPSDEKNIFWGILSCHEEGNFIGPVGIALRRMDSQAEDYLCRHPLAKPITISNSLIEQHDQKLRQQRNSAVEQISDKQLTALNEASTSIFKMRGPIMLLRDPQAFLDPLNRQTRTIFIPKYPKVQRLDCDHLQVVYDSDDVSLKAVYPAERWNPLSRMVLLREMDTADRYGALIFDSESYRCAFTVIWCIDPGSSRAHIYLPNLSADDVQKLGDSSSSLKDLVNRMPREKIMTSVERRLSTESGTKAFAEVSKVFEMGKPIWRLEVQVYNEFLWTSIKNWFMKVPRALSKL